jgi:D-3-phosphoglycerate dehydrogenase
MQLLADCVGFLAGVEPVTAKVLESAHSLRVISRNGSGLDNIDLDAAKKLNIMVCRADGANARGVAELTMALILSLTRAIPATDARLKQAEGKRKNGIELQGRTLGLIGCGRIGQEVARLALGFDMRVLAYDPVQAGLFSPSLLFRYGSFDDVLSQSDIVSLHCPPLPDGRPLVCADTIRTMKKGSISSIRPGGRCCRKMMFWKPLSVAISLAWLRMLFALSRRKNSSCFAMKMSLPRRILVDLPEKV